MSQSISLTIHAAIIVLLLLLTIHQVNPIPGNTVMQIFDPPPLHLKSPAGGGGMRQPLPATKGMLPPRSPRVFTPPMQLVNYQPKLVMPATIDAPPDVPMSANLLGDPSGVGSALSGGPGGPLGFGTGSGRSVGGGMGDRYGDGVDGGVYSVGRGVTMPVPIRMTEPEYSEDARKARLSGNVRVYAEIDAQGHPRNLRIVHGIGLGLDDKALQAVANWLFRPGTKDGKPVTVRAIFDVNFRLL